MKRVLFFLLSLLPLGLMAQNSATATEQADSVTPAIRFAYLSYEAALKAMPHYAATVDSVDRLRESFNKEVQRVEDEFNQKYESFLEGQKDFPRTILLKRQNELKELMQRNIEFKAQARKELQQAEAAAFDALKKELNGVLAKIAREYGYALIINTDVNACPFIDPALSTDIQTLVEDYLK